MTIHQDVVQTSFGKPGENGIKKNKVLLVLNGQKIADDLNTLGDNLLSQQLFPIVLQSRCVFWDFELWIFNNTPLGFQIQ